VSALAGLAWPPLPSPRAARILALIAQFEAAERAPPEARRRRQRAQAGALLAHAARNVPFYRRRLRDAVPAPGAPVDPDAWAALPTLTRREVQAAGSELRSVRAVPGHGPVAEVATSGSTGTPVRVWKTAVTQLLWDATVVREHLWHGRDSGARLCAIRHGAPAAPDGGEHESWGPPVAGVFATGPFAHLDIYTDVDAQLAWLERQRPRYLLSLASNVAALARRARERGLALAGLEQIRSYGETVDDELRALCREAWGADLVDCYSAQEVGYLALQCPSGRHYHALDEIALVEVLDERGAPCPPGAVGRVVVTPLHNLDTPLVRYEVGDYAEVGGALSGEGSAACGCGRTLPVLARILGRTRNMLVLPDGTRRWPRLRAPRYRAIAPVVQHRVVQEDLRRVRVQLVVERPLTAAERGALADLVVAGLGHPFEVSLECVEAIERHPGGKFEEFRSEIAGDRSAAGPEGPAPGSTAEHG